MNIEKRIEHLQSEIDNLKKEIKERKFKVGDWVKFPINNVGRIEKFVNGYPVLHNDLFKNYGHKLPLTKAAKQEIKEVLIKEAKRRGFVDGCSFQTVSGWSCIIKEKDYSAGFTYNDTLDILFYATFAIYKNGKWGSVIKEKTKIFEWEVTDKGHAYDIGCHTFKKEFLSDFVEVLGYVDDKRVSDVIDEINKLEL